MSQSDPLLAISENTCSWRCIKTPEKYTVWEVTLTLTLCEWHKFISYEKESSSLTQPCLMENNSLLGFCFCFFPPLVPWFVPGRHLPTPISHTSGTFIKGYFLSWRSQQVICLSSWILQILRRSWLHENSVTKSFWVVGLLWEKHRKTDQLLDRDWLLSKISLRKTLG